MKMEKFDKLWLEIERIWLYLGKDDPLYWQKTIELREAITAWVDETCPEEKS